MYASAARQSAPIAASALYTAANAYTPVRSDHPYAVCVLPASCAVSVFILISSLLVLPGACLKIHSRLLFLTSAQRLIPALAALARFYAPAHSYPAALALCAVAHSCSGSSCSVTACSAASIFSHSWLSMASRT